MTDTNRVEICHEFIEHAAHVVAVEGDYAWVEAQRSNACGHCSADGACGVSAVSKMIRLPNPRLRVPLRLGDNDLRVGDGVIVGVPEAALVKAALSAYLLPLLMVLAGGLLGQMLSGTDPGAVLGALLLPALLFPLWRRLQTRRRGQQVYVLRRAPAQTLPSGVALVEWPPRA